MIALIKSSMKHLVDSSVWVGLFLDFDVQHRKAVQLVHKLKGVLYIPYCVLNEVATVLVYKHSKAQADQFLDYIAQNRDIKLVSDSSKEEIRFYRTISHRISFTDAALLYLSETLDAELITFDRQLNRIAKKRF